MGESHKVELSVSLSKGLKSTLHPSERSSGGYRKVELVVSI